ncbi:E3 ubiquitin-protein ligase UBR5-like isoform X3 [Convolutriloba macropyga]|uniref:E3 ubiquitin-protein ligase UBR5-like isoform X3 n=1 Tax=Convolutriloba macropyga TaxID=536237 RepID=UPI003F525B81
MDEFRFFTYSLPGSDEIFNEKLSSVSDSINKQKVINPPWVAALGQSSVRQIAVASSHIAILLEDGRICRIAYSLNAEHIESNKNDSKSLWSAKKPKKKSARLIGGLTGAERVPYRRNVTSATIGSSSANAGASGGSGSAPSRPGRPNYRNLFMSSVPFIPPSQVPEDLIVQVQNVLQGKSRSLIIRELQRTNLDVNSAVNNLLSRDDEDGEDDEVGDLFADDLMSFVENNLSERAGNYILESEQMLVEDYLNYATAYRSSSTAANVGRQRLSLRNEILRSTGITSSADRGSGNATGASTGGGSSANPIGSSATGASGGSGTTDGSGQPWELGVTDSAGVGSGGIKGGKTGAEYSTLIGGGGNNDVISWEEPEWFILLPDAVSSPPPKFVQIAAMHSELVALSKSGQVYQWKWNVSMPFVHPDIADVHHPRIAHLDLQSEVIISLAASSLRCSVLTQSGRVATWMDPVVASYCSKLEHGAIPVMENASCHVPEAIKELKVCDLFTVAVAYSAKLFWWGVAPFAQRRKLLEKQAASKNSSSSSGGGSSRYSSVNDAFASRSGDGASHLGQHSQQTVAITEGCLVTKKKSPMYHAGAIGFCCDATFPPKVGQLMEDIWNLDASCRFKILPLEKKRGDDCKKTEMLPPPSPVSVGSEGSHKSSSRKRRRSVSPHPFAQQPLIEEEIEEYWNPKNVVFLEDSQNIPIGTVLKVDGNIAVVKFPSDKQQQQQQQVVVTGVCSSMSNENSNHSTSGGDEQQQNSILRDCRLFHKSDLQALKSNALPKFMDCMQCQPKNILSNCAALDKLQLLSVAVDCKGVHVVASASQFKFYYCVIEPSSGAVEERRSFFTDLPAFIGLKNPISLQVAPEDPGRLLMDGNGCFYPLSKDDAGQMREPSTLNMLPIKTAAIGVHQVREGAPSIQRVLLTAFITKSSPTMTAVLQCNQHLVEMRLAEYELNPDKEGPSIVAERCDGNRNIIHALVSMGKPTANTSQQPSSSGSSKSGKDDSNNRTSHQASGSSAIVSDANQTTVNSNSTAGAATSIIQTPIDADRVIAHFEQQQHPASVSSVQGATSTAASLTAATNALQNGAEILRRLREEMNAATEAARRQLALPGTAFDTAIPTIAWPPDPPAYENVPLSTGSLLDIPSAASSASRAAAASMGPILSSAITSCLSNTLTSNSLSNQSGLQATVGGIGNTSAAIAGNRNNQQQHQSLATTPSTDEERQKAALKILILLLTFSRADFEKRLIELLSLQDGRGMTPLMLAVNLRAYNMAMLIFNAAKRLATEKGSKKVNEELLMSMVFPPACASRARQLAANVNGASSGIIAINNGRAAAPISGQQQHQQQMLRRDDPDYSPLYMVCGNDNCSFTWTGSLHINQDIFECRTCGLHDTYCCCTECAKTCHKGHDCKLKKIWPTAYCDCWRRGRCCALIEGDQKARYDLLVELLQHTNLAAVPNRKGEHLLLCLVNTISRQMLEQSGLAKSGGVGIGGSGSNANKNSSRHHPVETENLDGMPDHNLDPPKFCRMALCQTVVNWKAVSSLMLQNANNSVVLGGDDAMAGSSASNAGLGLYDDLSPQQSAYLKSQTGSAKLDAFTYKLIVKCKNDTGFVTLEKLCETLVSQLKKEKDGGSANNYAETMLVVRRFVRSVCRVFVVLSMETQSSKNKVISSEPLRKCKTVFRMLMGVAIEELVETADCLLAPVRMGVARPTRPFISLSTTDEKQGSAELFSMEPLPPRRNAIAAAPGASTSVTFALDQQSQQQSRNSSNNLNASSTNDRSSTRDRTDYAHSSRRADLNVERGLNTMEETIPGLTLTQSSRRDRLDARVGSAGPSTSAGHLGTAATDNSLLDFLADGISQQAGNQRFEEPGTGTAGVVDGVNTVSGVDAGDNSVAMQLDAFTAATEEHHDNLGDQDDLDDDEDGHGSSADGGVVGEDDVTFEVDMMEEEEEEEDDEESDNGGVVDNEEDNSEDEEEEDEDDDDDDDDDLDVPSGGEEQHHHHHSHHHHSHHHHHHHSQHQLPLNSSHPAGGHHSNTQGGSNVPGSRSSSSGPNALASSAGVGGGRDSRATSPPPRPPLSSRVDGDPSDISAPHSPILDSTRTTIDSAGDLAYFSNTAIGSSSGPGLRDRAIIGGASDGGVMSDGEESRSSSQDDESEVGADQGHRGGENELVDDLYLTESTLDAAVVDNLGGGGHGSSNSNQSASRNVPVAIQWAVGGQPVVVPAPPTRGMIYVDPATIRRGGVSNAAAVAAGAGGSLAAAAVNLGAGVPGSSLSSSAAAESTCSSTATNVSLSRAFSLIMRSVTELVFLAAEEETDGGYMTQQQFDALQEYVDKRLYITWEWLSSVLDSAEAQLRFGAALINSTDTNHPLHPLNASQRRNGNNGSNSNGGAGQNSNSNSSSESNSLSNSRRAFEGGVSRSSSRSAQQDSSAARKDFLNYILSLMRAHSNEHADALPVIDVSAFKHIAYVLDAMLYYLKNGKEAVVKSQDVNLVGPSGDANSVSDELDDYDPEDDSLDEAIFVGLTTGSGSIDDFTPVDAMSSKKGFSFFRRSPSTLCLGATSPDPFSLSYAEALPLAERPQLLTPHATKEEMFGPARFDQGFTLERNQAPSSSLGANETLTIRRTEVEIVPLRMDMDGRIESGYERLLIHDTRVNSAEILERQDTAGQRSPEFPFYGGNANEAATAASARRASTGMSDGEPEIITERQSVEDDDDLEPGALDMSSSTLNAAEAAERQLHTDGNEAGTVVSRDRSATSDMGFGAQRNDHANWNRDLLATGPGCSTPNRDSFTSMAVQASTADVHTIQDMIEEVTTSTTVENVTDFTYTLRKLPRVPKVVETNFNRDVLLGRWSHSLELFGRVFIDDVGAQPGSLLAEISSFDVREARFKKEMERIRNSQTRDLALDVERDKSQLILQTMRQLNSQYSKRSSFPGQPLAVHKVKVTFKNEPGEGTGVSRSFYTAIAQALLTEERLPKLDSLSAANNSVNAPMSRIRKVRTSTNLPSATSQFANQLSSYERRSAAAALILGSSSAGAAASSLNNAASIIASHHGRSHTTSTVPGSITTSAGALGTGNVATVHSSSSAPSLTAANSAAGASSVTMNVNAAPYIPSASEIEDDSLRASIYAAVVSLQPSHASKITGMLLDLERHHLLLIKSDPDLLREKVEEALGLILSCAGNPVGANSGSANSQAGSKSGNENSSASMLGDAAAVDDDESAPLFYQPGKTGFYSPRLGKCTKERLDVFRNVGRLIGLCLLQNELIPLPLNRHVLKYILHKELSWHDFAFFDPVTYESMRKLVLDAMDPAAGAEMFKELCLTYSVVLCKEEGGGEVELVPNGAKYEVTPKNVFDFVRRYCEYRMRQCMEKPLRMIRRGVYEVVPPSALSDLTAEDLRLLLNGTSTIDPKQLSSFTNFIDETGGDHPEKIRKFKRSFWTVVEKMTQKELQDLMYFWTGSPSVPASEEGFQPMPSITLRPADDNYFPSANTCISRLYIPLYSSKNQLKFKLLQAIQVKSFGFV